ncbi:MAG TPA: gluconate 2-dehydrogenase subunit 3 family protein [Steroidobacteraceae bacterium]|nr:gluconate 2-dehydrogenase subunit 3 family protein [Steroidobacteraceae bacterium]
MCGSVTCVDRREFLESVAGITALLPGLALLPLEQPAFAAGLHARAQAATALRTLGTAQNAAVSCIAEILLPQTDTVGATEVGVNRFIDLLLTDSMVERDRNRFLEGLAAIDARSRALYGAPVASAHQDQQQSLLRSLDEQLPPRAPTKAEQALLDKQPVTAERGYELLKRLVVFAYFTSAPVAKDLIKAPIIPGRYDGCVST